MSRAKKVKVLGTEYSIVWDNSEGGNVKLENAMGYTEPITKKLVIDDRGEDPQTVEALDKLKLKVLRHEIIHAFLIESGLDSSSDWARNEEMVDWVALQFPKMAAAMKEVGAL